MKKIEIMSREVGYPFYKIPIEYLLKSSKSKIDRRKKRNMSTAKKEETKGSNPYHFLLIYSSKSLFRYIPSHILWIP